MIALSGMTTDALNKWHESLSKQTLNDAPIDMYFYSDYRITRLVDITLATPLISIAQYTRPSRIVFADGTFKREGLNEVLQWMVDNRNKGYFLNMKNFQMTGHKVATFEEGKSESYADELKEKIVNNLGTMCNDKVNFPVLEEFNFNGNAYNEHNDGFDAALRNACKKSETGVTVRAREVSVTIPPMCKTGDNTNYWYYDMNDEKEIAQCRYTWNWEYLVNPKYSTAGPYPNDQTKECE